MRSRVVAQGKRIGERVAHIAGPLLEVPSLSAQLDLLHGQRDVALVAELSHESFVQGGIRTELVIDMKD
jgi:hypothetical protein